jgi:hypothetical protein
LKILIPVNAENDEKKHPERWPSGFQHFHKGKLDYHIISDGEEQQVSSEFQELFSNAWAH